MQRETAGWWCLLSAKRPIPLADRFAARHYMSSNRAGIFPMRQVVLCVLSLFLQCGLPSCAAEVNPATIVENGSPPSRATDATDNSAGQSRAVRKLGLSGNKSSTNTTWSQGSTLSVNGPIPAIVVDQFGYPTRASKI